jgi:hypothetical protein
LSIDDALEMDRYSLLKLIEVRAKRIQENQDAHPENKKMEKEMKKGGM